MKYVWKLLKILNALWPLVLGFWATPTAIELGRPYAAKEYYLLFQVIIITFLWNDIIPFKRGQ